MLHRYLYKGPVMRFNTCVDPHWEAETMAENEKKAINNLAFRYKKKLGLAPKTKITLPGDLYIIN